MSLQRRTEMSEEITTVGEDNDLSWLADIEEDDSLDCVQKHRVLPRVKVIQSSTKRDVKEKYGEGNAVLMPSGIQLLEKGGDKVLFVPIFSYSEYGLMSDRDDDESPMFLDKTLDIDTDLGMRCTLKNKAEREEFYGPITDKKPQGFTKRYVEIINFPGVIYGDHPYAGIPISLTFMKGEFYTGTNFGNNISMRRVNGKEVPMWCQVWSLEIAEREYNGDDWYGIEPLNPENGNPLYISGSEMSTFKAHYLDMKQLYKAQALHVDHESAEKDDTETSSKAAEASEI